MLFIVTLLVPFILFIGGSYLLHYPLTLGVLYAFNVTLIYFVLWAVFNQAVKINTQTIALEGDMLHLLRKKLFMSFPLIREQDLEIPLAKIREIDLIPTGVGYELTVRFADQEKFFGIDMDINPLNSRNPEMIRKVLTIKPDIVIDEKTKKTLDEFEEKMTSWKNVYLISTAVIFLALFLFFAVSIYLAPKISG